VIDATRCPECGAVVERCCPDCVRERCPDCDTTVDWLEAEPLALEGQATLSSVGGETA
jgi:hypothetical protein